MTAFRKSTLEQYIDVSETVASHRQAIAIAQRTGSGLCGLGRSVAALM
jgi:hypothetical protein